MLNRDNFGLKILIMLQSKQELESFLEKWGERIKKECNLSEIKVVDYIPSQEVTEIIEIDSMKVNLSMKKTN